jgi:competence CoiA-like predicted nuclease
VRLESKAQVTILQNNVTSLQATESNLATKVKNFAQIQKSNTRIKSSISKIEHICSHAYSKNRNPLNYILEISYKIPATAYLTNVNFTKKEAPALASMQQKSQSKQAVNPKHIRQIEIDGVANSIKCANHLIHQLSQNTNLFKKMDLVYIKKTKKNNSKKPHQPNLLKYQFRASGELNYIC